MNTADVKGAIRTKVRDLARGLGHDASRLRDDEVIPETGLLDSAALMELMVWYENEYGLSIPVEDFTVENFGSIDRMAQYLHGARSR